MKKVLLPIALLLVCFQVYSQPGSLDLSFAGKGYVHGGFAYNVHVFVNVGKQVLAHPDGSSYLVFTLNMQTFIMHRLANGNMDQWYGRGGYAGPVNIDNTVAAMQPDGKIVLGGKLLGRPEFLFARVNTDGTLDNSFSTDGVQRIDVAPPGYNYAGLNGLALHNGKIVGVGYNLNEFSIVRLLSDGSLDNTFSDDGKQTVTFGSGLQTAQAVAVTPAGRIIVAGNAQGNMAVAALLNDGSLDNSFSGDGRQTISVEGSTGCAAVAIQPDGKIVLAGTSENGAVKKMALARLNVNGGIDNDFSTDGKLLLDFGTSSEANALALQNNGKIIVAGVANPGLNADIAIASINPDGTPDYSFSNDGQFVISLNSFQDAANSIAIQPDGRIIVGGHAGYFASPQASYAMLRFNIDGSLDNSFNGNGIIVGYKPVNITEFEGCAVQPDGKIIAVGGTRPQEQHIVMALARYNPNGTADNTFSGDGKLDIEFGSGDQSARAVALQPDGKIVVGGNWTDASGFYFLIVRLNPDGSLDNSFSGDGKALINFEASPYGWLGKIAIQPDGKIVAVGLLHFPSERNVDYAVARLNADGTPDNSFSGDGRVTTDLGGSETPAAVLLAPNGKIVVPGTYQTGNDARFMIVQYNADGTLDHSFNGQGWVITNTDGNAGVASGALQPDGKIIAAGIYNTGARFTAMRYTSNGLLDNSFSGDGIFISDVVGSVYDMALQPNGKIILAGVDIMNDHGIVFARINPDGTPDPGFINKATENTELDEIGAVRRICLHGNRLYAAGFMDNNGMEGLIAAFKLDCSLNVTIPDAFTLGSGVDANTVYPGYQPASDLTLLAQPSDGTAPYSYLWSNGAATSAITITPTTAANWTVTVTDAAGCSNTASKFVKVSDVHCGNNNNKVLLCEVPKGNPANARTVCVNASAVPAQLNNGAYLGNCSNLRSDALMQVTMEEQMPELSVYPNPGSTHFTLIVRMPGTQPVTLMVFDNLGRAVERKQVFSNQQVKFGMNYRPGIYYVECIQGEAKRTIKVVKL